jgi:hypothetical protein
LADATARSQASPAEQADRDEELLNRLSEALARANSDLLAQPRFYTYRLRSQTQKSILGAQRAKRTWMLQKDVKDRARLEILTRQIRDSIDRLRQALQEIDRLKKHG